MKTYIVAFVLAILAGCTNEAAVKQSTAQAPPTQQKVATEQPASTSGPVYVDVRTQEEYAAGHVRGAILIPHDQIEARLAELAPFKDREVVLYCRSGRRAGLAEEVLKRNGFKSVRNAGGFEDMKKAGVATEEPAAP